MSETTQWLLAFVTLVLVLGGLGAAAIGRALAHTWAPIWHLVPATFALTVAVGFLHYALAGLSAIPLLDLAACVSGNGCQAETLGFAVRYTGVADLVLLAVALLTYRAVRTRQMVQHYGFAFERDGLLRWRAKQIQNQSHDSISHKSI